MPSEDNILRILGRVTSINVRKVLWTADELGLAYAREDWGMPLRDPKVPEFLALNPNGLVPVLVDGDFVLWESHPIMGYLAEGQSDTPLIPAHRRARATMAQWLAWQQTELSPAWGYAFLALGRPTPGYDDPQQIARSIQRWSAKVAILEAQLADGRPFVNGDDFTLADIALGLAMHRWQATPFDKPPLPSADAYYARLKTRPAAAPYLTAGTP
ncbi:MAG: glutathione S-transferase family protein [Devosia sp.]|nr:glutathione S-transferase family protein [Devosia sp.]